MRNIRQSKAAVRPQQRRAAPAAQQPIRPAQLLPIIARIGSGIAVAAGDGGGLTPDACGVMAAELRTVYRVLRSLAQAHA